MDTHSAFYSVVNPSRVAWGELFFVSATLVETDE